MFDKVKDKLSVENFKNEIKKTVYGNRDTFLAKLDPRVLLIWYVVYAILPWLFFNRTILVGFCLILIVIALMSRVSKMILIFLAFGVISDIVSWGVTSLLFGGDLTVFWSLTTVILKVLSVSLASIAVFSTLEPDRFADGLLALGVPDQFAFGLSYGYRMIPVFLEEYQNIFNAYRLRGKGPEKPGFLYLRQLAYFIRLVVKAFYPMVLNTAKRTRTTVEGLQIKGYTYAIDRPEIKKIKLAHLKVTDQDILFLALTVLVTAVMIEIGKLFPL